MLKQLKTIKKLALDKYTLKEKMEIEVTNCRTLRINAPEWYQAPDFLRWLNNQDQESNPLMTWHRKGAAPTEWSDIIVFVDPSMSGEGSDQNVMPKVYWDFIIEKCRLVFTKQTAPELFSMQTNPHIIVRITNLQE
ncbi:hypothetical protein [Microbulbifer epialgicus]|uniref:Uncharacterized protein n=1 Tax=Microbulbifer epialgicus TaxID=393907 RepID=A0ABV4NTX7_9GAMM